jgi:plasmid rolling circle replication initiator protein Rep
MRSIIITIAALLYSLSAGAQADSLQKKINEQVWKPFIKSFNEHNTEGFMAVHSKDMTRVLQDSKTIYGYETYYRNMKNGEELSKKNERTKESRKIELRFTQRIAGNDRALDIGYYKVYVVRGNGDTGSYYGKFHVLLRKENGTWKILMDADANEKTDETIFMSAAPME